MDAPTAKVTSLNVIRRVRRVVDQHACSALAPRLGVVRAIIFIHSSFFLLNSFILAVRLRHRSSTHAFVD